MYLGRSIEECPVDQVFRVPVHPYTAALVDATTLPDPRPERCDGLELPLTPSTCGAAAPQPAKESFA